MSDLSIIGVIESQTLNIIGEIESKEINIIAEIIGTGPQGIPGPSGSGTGDMLISVYDPDSDGKINYLNLSNTPLDTVQSVAGRTGIVTLTSADVGLSNVNNTSDLNKPVSTATTTALGLKSDTTHTHSGANMIYNNGASATPTYIHLARTYMFGTYNRAAFTVEYFSTGTTPRKGTIECYIYNTTPYSTISTQTFVQAYVKDKSPFIAADIKIVKSACVAQSALIWDIYVFVSDYGRAYLNTIFSLYEIGTLIMNPEPLTKFDTLPIVGATFVYTTYTFTIETVENGVIRTITTA